MYPTKSWPSYETTLRSIGERRPNPDDDGLILLRELGFVDSNNELTDIGQGYFHARFIQADLDQSTRMLHEQMLNYPPAAALVQLLSGIPSVDRWRAESVLRNQGFGEGLTDRGLGSLLMLMHHAKLINYQRSKGEFTTLVNVAQEPALPSSVFISPETPFGNRVWLRRILEECTGFVYWLDKHFMPAAFEAVWEASDGSRITEIRILSLYLTDHGSKRVKRSYHDIQRELNGRSVMLEWRVIRSSNIRDTHDRWIIGEDSARNIPNVNAILSGQHSEINLSDQRDELEKLFGNYWAQAMTIDQSWNGS